MAWYKLDAHCGPGHQSHHEEYRWYEETPSEDSKQGWFDGFVATTASGQATGDITAVDELPADERLHQILKYRRQLQHAKYMLTVLNQK